MGHFARVDKNNIVKQVIVAEYNFLDENPQLLEDGDRWIRTSYNTHGGVHLTGDMPPLRKNYAGVGFTYDVIRDAFIPPKPTFDSWLLNEETCLWEPPIPCPNDGKFYNWNEENQTWDELVL